MKGPLDFSGPFYFPTDVAPRWGAEVLGWGCSVFTDVAPRWGAEVLGWGALISKFLILNYLPGYHFASDDIHKVNA